MKKCEAILSSCLQEAKELEKVINEAESRLRNAPEGSVRIIEHRNSLLIWHCP